MTPERYERLGEALDFVEGWLNYWAGLASRGPRRPRWLPRPVAASVKRTTQALARNA